MNKCLQCTNMHKQKTASGNYRITCAVTRDVVLFGELGNEPIVDCCGKYSPMREYGSSCHGMAGNGHRAGGGK